MGDLILLAAEEPRIHLPHTEELVWGSIAFLIVLVFLAKAVFPRVSKMLEERAQKIRGEVEEAERTRREADGILEEYRGKLADARSESQRIIDEAKRSADAIKQDIESRAQREAQDIVTRARAEVSAERERALQELRATLGDLSIQLATKVVGRELSDPESQRALVGRMIDELGRTGGNGNGANGGGGNGTGRTA